MKINRLILNLIIGHVKRMIKKGRRNFTMEEKYKIRENVPYINDGNFFHQIDIMYGVGKKKNLCIIDIHGGAYVLGDRKNNLDFGKLFCDAGYDFIAIDYEPNDGKHSTLDLFNDCLKSIDYISNHIKELNIEYNRFAIIGDSAGGHFALLLTEILNNKQFASNFIQISNKINFVGTLVNCPVYDFRHLGDNVLTKSGFKRMLGPNYKDDNERTLMDPKSHKEHLTTPVFVSTCTHDFIRNDSLMLFEDLKDRADCKCLDIKCDNPNVDHVHNITKLHLVESKTVNNEMLKFIETVSK